MGVEYQIRCSQCKERVVLHKLRESYEPVQQIVDGSFKHSDLLENSRMDFQVVELEGAEG